MCKKNDLCYRILGVRIVERPDIWPHLINTDPVSKELFSVTTIRTVLVSILSFSINMFSKCLYWAITKFGVYSKKAFIARLFIIIIKMTFIYDIALEHMGKSVKQDYIMDGMSFPGHHIHSLTPRVSLS